MYFCIFLSVHVLYFIVCILMCVCVCVRVFLQLIHSMMMSAVEMREAESSQFQLNFIKCGGIQLIFDVLTDADFLSNGDNNLKRFCFCKCSSRRSSHMFLSFSSCCSDQHLLVV